MLSDPYAIVVHPADNVAVAKQPIVHGAVVSLNGATITLNGNVLAGHRFALRDIPAGEAFGFFAAIDGHPRSTNVISVEDSRIARMAAPDFRKVLYSHPDVNRAFMLYLVDRIRSTSGRFTTVATLNAEQRLISEILRLAKRGLIGKNTAVIDPVPTQKDLALLTFAAHREAVGRDMSKLRDAGLIERKGRKLIIKNLSGLAARLRID